MESFPHSSRWPWIMLPARTVLFFVFQALFVAGFFLAGSTASWDQSAAWWPFTATLTNLVCIYMMVRLFRQEGGRYWDIFRFDRQHIKGDLLVILGVLVIAGPIAMLPNPVLAKALYGDSMIPMHQFIVPLPAWAIYTSMLFFPVTQGLAELAVYFLYVMPRLARLTGKPWIAYILSSIFLGFQHIMIPFRFDIRFMVWRGLMFIPFAFLLGAVLKWRPRLLPYLAIVHVLIDFATTLMYLTPF